MNQKEKINELISRFNELYKRQRTLTKEMEALKEEIKSLQSGNFEPILLEGENEFVPEIAVPKKEPTFQQSSTSKTLPKKAKPKPKSDKIKSDWEKFIGENLINKIGILITIIGVGIGAKYSIDNDLISPLTRIILGYLVGFGLLGFGYKLRANYENFSAVLVSGAMAILYFITFAAYDFYQLFPSLIAFGLMVIFTIFTVLAAIRYNRQIIAHIGLVGAYAIPFLLSSEPGNMVVFFTYITIINIGILFVSLNRYWKALSITAFVATWLIFFTWLVDSYEGSESFRTAAFFSFTFFVLFYITFLARKLIQKEKFGVWDVVLILANAFVFYGIGYGLMHDLENGEQFLGIYTLANAVIHFIVSAIVYHERLANRNLLLLVTGLVLIFITIAIPVQLDGNWVTLLWALEAALIFWLGRTKQFAAFEILSYPLMLLAFGSLLEDWNRSYPNLYLYAQTYEDTAPLKPIFNIQFLSSLLFALAFAFIGYTHYRTKEIALPIIKKSTFKFISWIIPSIFLIVLYMAFRLEIQEYWHQLFDASSLEFDDDGRDYSTSDNDLLRFGYLWIMIYSLVFLIGLSLLNLFKIKDRNIGILTITLSVIAILVFLGEGLYEASVLRESYLEGSTYYNRGISHILIRYIGIAAVLGLLYFTYRNIRAFTQEVNFRIGFDYFLILTVLWISSSELIHWINLGGYENAYKLGLSIFWGIFSLILIGIGIWKKQKHLRIAAIVLFGITLVKLFFYDIAHLNTISKTIVFVSLGILLLIISFLYNKYKDDIADDNV